MTQLAILFLLVMILLGLIRIAATLSDIHNDLVGIRKGLYYRLCSIEAVLREIKHLLKPAEGKAYSIEFYEVIGGELKRVTEMVQSIEETKKYKIVAKDKAGNEAKFDGAPKLSFDVEDKADIIFNEDGSFDVAPKGPIGDAKLQVVVDADLGEGVEEIFGEAAFTFVAGKAVAIEVVPV